MPDTNGSDRPAALRALTLRATCPLTRQRAAPPPLVKGPLRRCAPLTSSSAATGGSDRGYADLWLSVCG